MDLQQISQIEAKIKYTFANKELLVRAFTCSSYANARRSNSALTDANERMAFLGDSVLEMIVSQHLYQSFPEKNKGELSYMRSNLVSRSALAPIIENLGVDKYLRFVNNTDLSEHLLGDLYEAIVCAIYLDGGFDEAKRFVLQSMSELLVLADRIARKDYKTLLQEYCQKNKISPPVYKQVEKSGTDDKPTFKYDLYIDNERKCNGTGSSKKAAEQDAAKKIVTILEKKNSALS
ncbi:MAG: ribonuclease III [Clostridia bacterium]|nr:ribonuclease III [Clostridia bacterium]